jgi:hypothetical protein
MGDFTKNKRRKSERPAYGYEKAAREFKRTYIENA